MIELLASVLCFVFSVVLIFGGYVAEAAYAAVIAVYFDNQHNYKETLKAIADQRAGGG